MGNVSLVRNVAVWRVVHGLPVVALAALLVTGCGSSTRDTLSLAGVIGTWAEDPSPLKSAGGVMLATTQPCRRQLAFTPDGTFLLTVCDAEGRPLEPAETVTGTWAVQGGALAFTVKAVALDAEHAGWVPERFLGWQPGERGAAGDRLELRGHDGRRVRYTRLPPAPPP